MLVQELAREGAHLCKEWKILTCFKVCFQILGTPQEQFGTEEGMVPDTCPCGW